MTAAGTLPNPTSKSEPVSLERALIGTSQQIVNTIDSDGWSTLAGKAELLADLRKRLDETSRLIGEWLEGPDHSLRPPRSDSGPTI